MPRQHLCKKAGNPVKTFSTIFKTFQREVFAVTVRTKLPAHNRAAVRIEAHFKSGAAIRFPQLGERGCLGHVRLLKHK